MALQHGFASFTSTPSDFMSPEKNEEKVVAKGLKGIIANESKLSLVEGRPGRLSYLGYRIEDLVEHCCFEEVVFLLHRQKLPNQRELDAFVAELREQRNLPSQVLEFIRSAPKDARPMDVLRTAVSMLGLFDTKGDDQDRELNQQRAISLIARVPLIVGYFHLARQDKELVPCRDDLSEAAHFLYLINGGEEPKKDAIDTLDVAYVLHADHSMNASTFSARVTIATLSDIYSAVTSAVGTLKGPLHGGANEGVIHMLEEIGSVDNVDAWVAERLKKREKIMGIGHRVYRTLDPRAPVLRKMAIQLTRELGETKWIEMSERIAEIMLKEKGLNANVDFYSATVYYSLGIPTDLFTPIFAIARTAGWTAHVLEQLDDNLLYRPLTHYTGPESGREIPPISERE